MVDFTKRISSAQTGPAININILTYLYTVDKEQCLTFSEMSSLSGRLWNISCPFPSKACNTKGLERKISKSTFFKYIHTFQNHLFITIIQVEGTVSQDFYPRIFSQPIWDSEPRVVIFSILMTQDLISPTQGPHPPPEGRRLRGGGGDTRQKRKLFLQKCMGFLLYYLNTAVHCTASMVRPRPRQIRQTQAQNINIKHRREKR